MAKNPSPFSSVKSPTSSPTPSHLDGSQVALEQGYSEGTSQLGMSINSKQEAPEGGEVENSLGGGTKSRSSSSSSDSRDASTPHRVQKSSDSDERILVSNTNIMRKKKPGTRSSSHQNKSS